MPGSVSSALIAAQAGSRDALGEALDGCRPYLLHLARQALGPALQAKGGASDLVQDTFLEATGNSPSSKATAGCSYEHGYAAS